MSNMIPFENAKLPAYLTDAAFNSNADDLTSGVGQGYPIISIKGKVFHMVKGDERTLIKRPGENEPAGSIDVVILKANPNLSKVYYSTGYVEGSDAKPECYSNDGKTPAADAESAQAKTCATCAHNQWGSRITENGAKGKSCADSRRIAIAMPGHLNEPMLVRVPAASLKALAQFGDMLKKRGVPNYNVVVTKIGFDYTVAHPALTFQPVSFVDEATALEAATVANEDIVQQIIGVVPGARALEAGETAVDAGVTEKAAPAKATPKPTRSKALDTEVKAADEKPKAAVKVEEEEAPTQAKPEAAVISGALADQISQELDNLDFDDE